MIKNDQAVLDIFNHCDDLQIVIFWPKSYLYPNKVDEIINHIKANYSVEYVKEQLLSYNGICNLLAQINRVRILSGGISGAIEESVVWDANGKCFFIVIRSMSKDEIRILEHIIKDKYGIFAFDVIQNIRESRVVANAIFNPNSVHFLNHGRPYRYKESIRILELYNELLDKNHREKKHYIIDSSMVMAVYGIRAASDLDYYSIDPLGNDCIKSEWIEEHDSLQKSYHNGNIMDLIVNPNNYFMFNELKFVSLNKLLAFKEKRYDDQHDLKDKNDILLIRMFLEDDNNKVARAWLLFSISFQRRKQMIKELIYKIVYRNG